MKRPTVGKLRRVPWLRSAFVWMLAVLLLAGAATYSQGTRYAISGNNFFAAAETLPAAVDSPCASAGQDSAAQDSGAITPVHQACPAGPDASAEDCCGRGQAPRGEPAPLRTGAVDPPAVLHWEPGGAHAAAPPTEEPEFRALTLAQLSVSRT